MATIQDLLRAHDMTWLDLATKARVSPSTLFRIASGASTPWRKTKQDIAAALGVAVEEIDWPEKQEKPEKTE